jgi:hypothetical protein
VSPAASNPIAETLFSPRLPRLLPSGACLLFFLLVLTSACPAAAIIEAGEAASFTLPSVPGDGVSIKIYNGIGGGRAPSPSDLEGRQPNGTLRSPFIDFPNPGTIVQVNQNFETFFATTAKAPDQVAGLEARNFILAHHFFLAVTQDLDRDPSTGAIDIELGVGSDDGFHLTVGETFIGSIGDRSFAVSTFPLSFAQPGLYEISLLFAANTVGQSGLEFYWTTAHTSGREIIPQAALYTTTVVGQQLITFEEQPGATVPADQYRNAGILFHIVSGDLQITNSFPADFVPVTRPNVVGSPAQAPTQAQVIEMTFVSPGTNEPGVTDLVQLFVIDSDAAPGAHVSAINQHGETVFDQRIVTGGAAQEQVTISAPQIFKVTVELGGAGTDTAAIDNVSFNIPRAADFVPPTVAATRITKAGIEIDFFDTAGLNARSMANLLNYRLTSSGTDGVFDNANDRGIPIVGAAILDADTVQLTANQPLSDDIYRLIINETPGVLDSSGNKLDGDGDGKAGGQFARVLTLDTTPELSIRFAPATVTEGSATEGTLTIGYAVDVPLTFSLESSALNRLTLPASVTIPPGETSVVFTALAVQNQAVELPLSINVSASRAGFGSASATLEIQDDDRPALSISLDHSYVSERDGMAAAHATIVLDRPVSAPLRIILSSVPAGNLILPSEVNILATSQSAIFPVGVVDNQAIDGPRDVAIVATLLDSIGANVVGQSAPVTLRINDDDGPSLRLAVDGTLLIEGQNPAATATVMRQPTTDEALVVSLASSNSQEMTVPPSVTIPAGQSSTTFPLQAVADGKADGNQRVTLEAFAAGFSSVAKDLIVTDRPEPDLVVELIAPPNGAETEAWIDVRIRLRNQGALGAQGPYTQRISLSTDAAPGNDILLSQADFSGLLPGVSSIEQSLRVRLPRTAGRYWLIAETDVNRAIDEALEDNNVTVAATPIDIEPAYSTTLNIAPETVPSGAIIPITGTATLRSGGPAAYSLVNIHVTNAGTRRVFSALTNANGVFETVFMPLPGEGGLFQFGAAHPGLESAPVQDEVNVYGLRAEPAAVTMALTENTPQSGRIFLTNLSSLPLSGLALSTTGLPGGVQFTPALSATNLSPSGSASIDYSISAAAFSGEKSFTVTVTSAQGASITVLFKISVATNRPMLVVEPGELVAGMLRGGQQFLNFTIRNGGSSSTGPINVVLPAGAPWLRLVTPQPLPALAPGESVPVTLQLLPPADLPLEEYSGRLLASNGVSTLFIPFRFRTLSDQSGTLVVQTEDEYTYYAQGNPPLAGASVTVTDALTRQVVATLVTDTNGTADFGALREGYYEIDVTADRHATFRATRLVSPGITNEVRAFLSRQIVTYYWNIQPTTIPDRYKITIDTTFETNVPLPVLIMTPTVIDLAEITADETIVNVTVTNHGLLAANDVQLNYPAHPKCEFTPLIKNLGVLPAQSSITVPVRIRRVPVTGARLSSATAGADVAHGECNTGASACAVIPCGDLLIRICANQALTNADSGCGIPHPVDGTPACPDCPPFFPGGLNQTWFGGSVALICDPTCLLLAGLNCLPLPPWLACPLNGVSCAIEFDRNGVNRDNLRECAVGFALCLLPISIPGDCIYGILDCLVEVTPGPQTGADGVSSATATGTRNVNSRATLSAAFDPLPQFELGGRAALNILDEITGAPRGVWINRQSGTDTGIWFRRFRDALNLDSDGADLITEQERLTLLNGALPPGVPASEINRFLERWNRTIANWERRIRRRIDAPPGDSTDFIDADALQQAFRKAADFELLAEATGFLDPIDAIVETVRLRQASGANGGICGRVKLRLEQDAVLTREAFRATLELDNNGATALQNVRVDLTLRSPVNGSTTNLFDIRFEGASVLSAVDGTGLLAGGSRGTARWLIIPTVDAAPDGSVQYFVGGTLIYVIDGVQVSLPFAEVPITVLPAPRLKLKYFHQRDVFSDDPFTDVIEPAIPYSLAVMVENHGAGVARDFHIASAQPRIIENEKGLLADFKIIATQVNGQPLQPSLTANFGNIDPGQITIGEWLMTSSIHGLFVDYEATFEHLDGQGNSRLSLIDSVEIYEMNHQVRALGSWDDGKPDFLVNQVPDTRDLPDTLHLSDGTTSSVAVVEQAQVTGQIGAGQFTLQLNVSRTQGWTYLRIPEPTNSQYALTRVVRSDGLEIPLDVNVWVTDRTFLGQGRRPTYENILHLVDRDGPGSYTLTYTSRLGPDTVAPASHIVPLPGQSPLEFQVSWEGTDDRGVVYYDVYVSTNGGAFQIWRQRTRETAALFAGELGNNYAFYSRATDAAGNTEGAPSAADATTTVTIGNIAPTLSAVSDQQINEGDLLILDLVANDSDGPANLLRFAFASAVPPGLTIESQTGHVRWRTGEADGGREVAVQVRVTDAGFPPLSTTRSFLIRVLEVNQPPALAAVEPKRAVPGQLLSLQLQATDADLPPQTIRYRLIGPAPPNMNLDAATGLITWLPEIADAERTLAVTLAATDSGVPPFETTQTIAITVDPANLNRPPRFYSNPAQLWLIGTTHTVGFTAFDPDGDSVMMSLNAAGLPSGVSFNSVSGTGHGVLTWNTSGDLPGLYSVSVTATAGAATALQTLSVKLVEDSPYWRWALIHLGNLSDLTATNPDADPDGDGEDNLSEFLSNTNPTDINSVLRSARALNISTRVRVLTDDKVLIGGFIITGAENKKVIIRAVAPSLAAFGIPNVLEDPVLELFDGSGNSIGFNNNWKDTQEAEIAATTIAPAHERESAIVKVLAPGNYTAVIRGNGGGVGIGLVEIYDLAATERARLGNISTRGFVDSGDNIMICGFIVGAGQGSNERGSARFLLRAIGPSLADAGVANALSDPILQLVNANGTVLGANDNWTETQRAEIEATGIPPSHQLESAILQTVSAGPYTVIVRGVNNTTGVALIEAYNLP